MEVSPTVSANEATEEVVDIALVEVGWQMEGVGAGRWSHFTMVGEGGVGREFGRVCVIFGIMT